MGTSYYDPHVHARLQSLINRQTSDTPPFGGFLDKIFSVFKAPASPVTVMRAALRSPTVVARAQLKAHLFALAGRPPVISPTPRRPGARRPVRQGRPTAAARPAPPPPPPPTVAQAASQPVTEPPPREIDVTPEQPAYDGFHGYPPGFNEARNDFGDLEADLGLD